MRSLPRKGYFEEGETMTTTSLPALDTTKLEKLSNLPTQVALQKAAAFLTHLVRDPAFLDAHAFPLLEEARGVEDWYVAHRYDGQDSSYSLQIFVWPAGTRTQIHDHTSWGAYRCVVGSVLEERYERLDDGSQLNHARLKKSWTAETTTPLVTTFATGRSPAAGPRHD